MSTSSSRSQYITPTQSYSDDALSQSSADRFILSHQVFMSEDLATASFNDNESQIKATYSDTFESEDSDGFSCYDYSDTFENEVSKSLEQPVEDNETVRARQTFLSSLVKRVRDGKDQPGHRATSMSSHKPHTVSPHLDESRAKCRRALILQIKHARLTNHNQSVSPPTTTATIHPLSQYGIHPSLMERLRLKQIQSQMERATKCHVHDPLSCHDCRAYSEALEGKDNHAAFIRNKTAAFRHNVIEDKIANHLVNMTSIPLIGELARSLPKPTTDPQTIYRQLMLPLLLTRDQNHDLETCQR